MDEPEQKHTEGRQGEVAEPFAEPIQATEQKTYRTNSKWIIAGIAIFVALYFFFTVGWNFLSRNVVPNSEDVFYDAVSNMMNTPHINQQYEYLYESSSMKVSAKINAVSDFTNPGYPKTMTTISFPTPAKTDGNMGADMMVFSSGELYGQLRSAPPDNWSPVKITPNRWYAIRSEKDAYYFDPYNYTKKVNETFGEFLVGKYTSGQRKELLDMYKQEKVFMFDSKRDVTKDTLGSDSIYTYNVAINSKSLKKVNERAATLLHIPNIDFETSMSTYIVKININTKRIVYVATSSNRGATRINISYPSALDIQPPKDYATISDINR